MENYLNAKAKLFKISDKGVVNFDDDGGKKIVANNDCDILKVGLSDGCDLKAKILKFHHRVLILMLNMTVRHIVFI